MLYPVLRILALAVAVFASPLTTPTIAAAQQASPVAFAWETSGGPDFPFDDPSQLAIDPEGTLWVTDSRNHRFQLFAPDGTFLTAWGEAGSGEGQFNFLRDDGFGTGAVAFGGDGSIYVADTSNFRIQKFDADRRFVAAWGGQGSGEGQFTDPVAIAVGRDGRVYVGDDLRNDIQVFDAGGTFLFAFGSSGAANGRLNFPGRLSIAPDGDVWVADWGNRRVQRFAPDGTFRAAWSGTGEGALIGPIDVAVDRQGRVYITDEGVDRVRIYETDGTLLTTFGFAESGTGQFASPSGIVLDGADHVYVSEVGNNRVQAFRLLPPLEPVGTPTT
jgi:sugar lactone lactonase YvrE